MAQIEQKGVQELIEQLQSEGVEKAREESRRIISEAEADAKKKLAEARAEADKIIAAAREERKNQETAFHSAAKLAARDVILNLKNEITRLYRLEILSRVQEVMKDETLLEKLVLDLGKQSIEGARAGEAVVLELPLGGEDEKNIENSMLARLKATLGEEVMLGGGFQGQGVRIRFSGSGCQAEVSDKVLAEMLADRLVPKFRRHLEGLH